MASLSRRTRVGIGLLLPLLGGAALVPLAAAADADHLILTEMVVDWRDPSSQFGSKFIEIANPTGTEIDLSDVYLTDATTQPTNFYYNLVTGQDAGGGLGGDFHCRFPAGAVIAPGDTIVVSVVGSDQYQEAYGRLPDFELFEDSLAPDLVPEMVEIFPGSIGAGLGSGDANTPDLTYYGETVVLYRWDGVSDLVQDLDYVIWGTSTQFRVDKSGIAIDGPDGDETPSSYLPDTDILTQDPIGASAHTFAQSLMRISADEGTETLAGGNGATGHDETSENLGDTWQITALYGQDPPTEPAGWVASAPIVMATELNPLSPSEGMDVTATVTLAAYDDVAAVTFYYSIDGGAFVDVAGSDNGDDTWSGTFPGQPAETEVSWYLTATGSGGGIATCPAGAPTFLQTYTVTTTPEPGEGPVHLLLTEVCVFPSPNEFVEIYNPSQTDTVDLTDYYLTDAIYTPYDQVYWRIVQGNPSQSTIGGGAYDDFHARFPAGSFIAPRDTVTVALRGNDGFYGAFGVQPTFELNEDGTQADDIPDLLEVFPGSNAAGPPYDNPPGLSNSSEIVIIYYWDGTTDLVTDIDVFFWGDNSDARFSKTGEAMDGPDPDGTATPYQAETAVSQQSPYLLEHGAGESFQRGGGEGGEIAAGSNGVDGHDEMSENLPVTWQIALASPATPGDDEEETDEATGIGLHVRARTFLPTLGEAFPIRFFSRRNCETLVRIFNLEGRLVLTLFDSRFDGFPSVEPGDYTRRDWDGRDSEFELVPAGLYVILLSVIDLETGEEETKTAPAVVATRLSED